MQEREQLEQLVRRLIAQTESGRLRWDESGDGGYGLRLEGGDVSVSEAGVVVRNRSRQEVGRVRPGELAAQLLAEARLSARSAAVVVRELLTEVGQSEEPLQGLSQVWRTRTFGGRFSPSR